MSSSSRALQASPRWPRLAALALGASALLGGSAWAGPFAEDCGLEPPESVVAPPVPMRPNELPVLGFEPPLISRTRQGGPAAAPRARLGPGALAGKIVYLSAGHGFTWNDSAAGWRTQRGTTHEIVEDLVSVETMNQLVIPMLLNAGAVVMPVREPDLNAELVVVDDSSPDYSESGPQGTFSDSAARGWGTPPSPLPTGTNPFELGGNRLMSASATATASATFAPHIPADGNYNVYLSYSQFSARVTDAHFVVKHAGGEAHFRVNQRRHGGTWLLLGRFYFRAGKHPETAAVVALNDSAESGNLSLDAVRFGGGKGLIDRGGGVSGRPRFEESSRYNAQFSGAPTTVYDSSSTDHNDDIATRSRFTKWQNEAGEDAVYVAWHTNAFSGNSRGTETYVYGPNAPDGSYQFTGVAGSDRLAQAIHGELINDLRLGWGEASWRDRGIFSAYFGELNPTHNDETPAVLLEIAFHDNLADATQLKEPLFRYVAARAITQGIIKYFAQRDQAPIRLPPEPPAAVAALNRGGGAVEVRWRAPATDSQGVAGGAATGYRLYSSADGLAWDDGISVAGTFHAVTLAPGTVRYFRVSSTNEGGESFPSSVVGARVSDAPAVLVVNAFDRLEAAMGSKEDLSAYTLGSVLRILVDRMNDGSYLRRHGDAIAFAEVGFDGASAEAVSAGEVSASAYAVLDWFAGRGHAGGAGPTSTEQQLLRAHLAAGKGLLFSGSHAATALAGGSAEDSGFLAQVLRASAPGGAGSLTVNGLSGQLLSDLTGLALDDGRQGAYDTGAPDVISPLGGAAIADYAAGSHAAIAAEGSGKVVFLAFPFETVVSDGSRAEAMGRFLEFFGVRGEEPPPPPPPVEFALVPGELPYYKAGSCGCGSGAEALPALGLLLALLGRRRR